MKVSSSKAAAGMLGAHHFTFLCEDSAIPAFVQQTVVTCGLQTKPYPQEKKNLGFLYHCIAHPVLLASVIFSSKHVRVAGNLITAHLYFQRPGVQSPVCCWRLYN